MKPYYSRGGIELYHGDCREVLAQLDVRVSAVVTDPPYGLGKEPDMVEVLTHWLAGDDYHATGGGFMGRSWDAFVPGPATWKLIAATMKPGAHLAAFSGTRTYDLMGIAIRLAGLQYRETAAWIFGSGFPKSLDVSKAIDKAGGVSPQEQAGILREARERAGMSRSDVARRVGCTEASVRDWEEGRARQTGRAVEYITPSAAYRERLADVLGYTADERRRVGASIDRRGDGSTYGLGHSGDLTSGGHTPQAQEWAGWGTALKPAYEPIILARKPLSGTVAANVLAHGTGALNIDASRVGTGEDRTGGGPRVSADGWGWSATGERPEGGRWPPNVILGCCGNDPHDADCAAALLDAQSGTSKSTGGQASLGAFRNGDVYGKGKDIRERRDPGYGDTGGASRFFPVLPIDDPDTLRFTYQAKASRRERNAGLDGLPERRNSKMMRTANNTGEISHGFERFETAPAQNHHPTVKPLALMRWLLTLVTPPGGIVLDPFAGSGTTGVAAAQLGIPCVLVEQEAEYLPIIAGRVDHALNERAGAELPLFAGVAD